MAEWVTGKIIKIHFWTDVLFSLIIQAQVHPFIAGQFTKLGLKIHGERVQRAYSYVNSPDDQNLEFYLINLLQGKLSPYLAALKVNDEIQVFSKASGFFILDEIPDYEVLWMIATGTALGPYLSILKYGKGLERFKHVVLVHAVRYSADLSYSQQILELKDHYKGKLRILTIVSRETVKGSLTGRIPILIKNGSLEEAVGLRLNNQNSHIMLCGNQQMLKDTQQVLLNNFQMTKNLRRKPGNITTEYYC